MFMQEPVISVIVPVYNVEKYLNRCVQSIVDQTYKNLEIILVDDGSPDHCPQMCDAWAKKDSRIQVIHKKNGGVASARNMGIKNSRGKYFAFIDPDDFIEAEMYELMHSRIKKDDSDLCSCNMRTVLENGQANGTVADFPEATFIGNDILCAYFSEEHFLPSTCDKLYKAEIVKKNNIFFSETLEIGEDFTFNYYFFKNSKRVSAISNCLYNYFYNRKNSASNKCSAKWLLRWKNTKKIRDLERNNEPVYKMCNRMFAKELLSCFKEITEKKKTKELKSVYKEILNEMKRNSKSFINSVYISKKIRISYMLFHVHPFIFLTLHRLNCLRICIKELIKRSKII